MYCPRCGQERISKETKYCSRCGLLLDYLARIAKNEGLPVREAASAPSDKSFTRKHMLIFSLLWFLLFVFCIVPILAIVHAGLIPIAILSTIGTMGAVIIAATSFLFPIGKTGLGEPVSGPQEARQGELAAQSDARDLPPATENTAREYASPAGDSDAEAVRQPPSVTEPTTKLLRKDED